MRLTSKEIAIIGVIITVVTLIVSYFNLRASLQNVNLNSERNRLLKENQEESKRLNELLDILK